MKRNLIVCIFCFGSLFSALTRFALDFKRVAVVHALTVNRFATHAHQEQHAEIPTNRKTVLVELITSSECNACAAAEQTLTYLDRDQPVQNTDIIVLHEQTKPMDTSKPSGYLSPTDPARRQENYQFLGTSSQPVPLFLVNGEVLGKHPSESQIEESIRGAQETPVHLSLTSVEIHGDEVSFSLNDGPALDGYVDVYAALVDAGPSSGGNGSQRTERGVMSSGMVETFGRVGSSFRTKALGRESFRLQAHVQDGHKDLDGMRLVVFLQMKHVGPVLGATSCVLKRDRSLAGPLPQASSPNSACPVSHERR